ncbi:MAG TPA: hypothetical protein VFA90_08495 [Terriglobales bacterium]|nr:hypothetical protein [Terriglobales bacterium]
MLCNLRVTKWLGMAPAVGVCTCCGLEFRVPLAAIKRTVDAQANLKAQFDRHDCQRETNTPVEERA